MIVVMVSLGGRGGGIETMSCKRRGDKRCRLLDKPGTLGRVVRNMGSGGGGAFGTVTVAAAAA